MTSLCSAIPMLHGQTVFSFLEKNPQLTVLNLSSNKMPVLLGESFTEQLGGQSSVKGKFSGIVSLNVSDNPIESVAAMVDEIVLLMPGVRDLQMSLYREADVDLII